MKNRIQVLDCTLRDGAYVVDAKFGTPSIKGIIKKMTEANIDIIECGWLKNSEHKEGTTFFHTPQDLEPYMSEKNPRAIYTAMIDWNRYNLDFLPQYDGKTIDAIRVVFPQQKFREGIEVGKKIKEKGYMVFYQAANTLGYSDDELIALAQEINKAEPVSLSVVDTFGAMFSEDLTHIVTLLDKHLAPEIKLGFHSHNNQQLSFASSMQFIEMLLGGTRNMIVDSSLCGMGRGAGNATTELIVNYLNKKYKANYDMNTVLDAIDTYMGYFIENYSWGYSTPYLIAGMYCAHVNNIAYLLDNHRTTAKDLRNVICALPEDERINYNYDLLEKTYIDYLNKAVDDAAAIEQLKGSLRGRKVLLISPGKSIITQKDRIIRYIEENQPVVIGVNAASAGYNYDYIFFSNKIRYDYARDIYPETFYPVNRILSSSVKTETVDDELIVNFNLLIKRGWEHFDNAVIMCLRLMNKLQIQDIALAGFDGFSENYSDSYCDTTLPSLNPRNNWDELNEEILDMFQDFKAMTADSMNLTFITDSKFDVETKESGIN